MTTKQTVLLAAAVALAVSATVLGLLWRFGIWEYMLFGRADLRVVFWPSSVIVKAEWCTTVRGVLITAISIVLNCLLYIGIALALRMSIMSVRRSAI